MQTIKNNNFSIVLIIIFLSASLIVYIKTKNPSEENIPREEFYKNYGINEVIYTYVSNDDLAKKYLMDYTTAMFSYTDKAYEMLTEECKEKRFSDYYLFENYINELISNENFMLEVSEYSYGYENMQRIMRIKTNLDINFTFFENSVMDYKVSVDF